MSKELYVKNLETMTLLEICKLTETHHSNTMLRVMPKLLELDTFNNCTKCAVVIEVNNGAKKEIETYHLNREQSFIVAAKLSDKLLEKVVLRWMELEKQAKGWSDSRSLTRECYKRMCDELTVYRNKIGKETKAFHYSNEARMINQIVLGVNKVNRDDQPKEILDRIDNLSVTNISLIRAGFGYDERKEVLKRADTPNVLTFKNV